MVDACGSNSRKSSSRLAFNGPKYWNTPVAFPLGALKLVTSPNFTGSAPLTKNNRDGARRLFRGEGCRKVLGHDDCDLLPHELRCEGWQAAVVAVCPSILDDNAGAFDKPGFG